MIFVEDVIPFFRSNIECVGLFQKNRGVEDILFWNPLPGIFHFFTTGNSRLKKVPPLEIDPFRDRSFENSKTKNQDPWKVHTIFLVSFGYSTSFKASSWKFNMLFLRYPWNCPLKTQVMCSKCLMRQWHTGELFYYQWPRLHHLIWEGLQIFFK